MDLAYAKFIPNFFSPLYLTRFTLHQPMIVVDKSITDYERIETKTHTQTKKKSKNKQKKNYNRNKNKKGISLFIGWVTHVTLVSYK